jgi:hypothetical protein
MQGEARGGIVVEGRERDNIDRPVPCGRVVLRNNTVVDCGNGLVLFGEVREVHVVGNRLHSNHGGIDLVDLREGAADILVANNTIMGSDAALRIWDDHAKGKHFLKCKNIRVQNNLVLQTDFSADMTFHNAHRHTYARRGPSDLQALLKSPQWRFSHNWREIDPVKAAASRAADLWIPGPNDHLQVPINVLSRTPGEHNFLRPPKGSPLAKGGVNDGSLPAYVGAVPPEGAEAWDWDRTWAVLVR